MTSLIFHGGHYKTGTTSLQHALRASEAGLAASGILYPRGLPDAQFGDVQQADLVTDCFAGNFDRVETYLAQLAAQAASRSCATILLSSELATSFYRFPEQFDRWIALAGRHFETPRYVFVVRDIAGYATSMYRELMKSGRISFHYESAKDDLVRLLCEQQRSIAFFRQWDATRITLLSFKTLAADRLVERLIKGMVGYDVDPMISAYLNSSTKKAKNIGALLLNDIYALVGASMGRDPLATEIRSLVRSKVNRRMLRQAFDVEFLGMLERAFLDVTAGHVQRVLATERATIDASMAGLPADVVSWLTDAV